MSESDAEAGRGMAAMSNAERLARAVLLFWTASAWNEETRERWRSLTGEDECTSRVLCDLARRVRQEEETPRKKVCGT